MKTILKNLGGIRLTTGRFFGFWIALFAIVFAITSCSDDIDVQQSYPFTVDVMPYGDKIVKGQTVELRFEIKPKATTPIPSTPSATSSMTEKVRSNWWMARYWSTMTVYYSKARLSGSTIQPRVPMPTSSSL